MTGPTRRWLFWGLGGFASALACLVLGAWLAASWRGTDQAARIATALPTSQPPARTLPSPPPEAPWTVVELTLETVTEPGPPPLSVTPTPASQAAGSGVPALTDVDNASDQPDAPEPGRALTDTDTSTDTPVLPMDPDQAAPAQTAALALAAKKPAAEAVPWITVVIDDIGPHVRWSRRAVAMPGPLTMAVLPYAAQARTLEALALANGHEVIAHIPMEPLSAAADPGPGVLTRAANEAELLATLRQNLNGLAGYTGVNNHMGSGLTADADAMRVVMAELKRRSLFFLDSRTSARSQGVAMAAQVGVPHTARDVFLDHDRNRAAITAAWAKALAMAQRRGTAVVIGHPYPETLAVLTAWMASRDDDDPVLVPLSQMIARRAAAGTAISVAEPG